MPLVNVEERMPLVNVEERMHLNNVEERPFRAAYWRTNERL